MKQAEHFRPPQCSIETRFLPLRPIPKRVTQAQVRKLPGSLTPWSTILLVRTTTMATKGGRRPTFHWTGTATEMQEEIRTFRLVVMKNLDPAYRCTGGAAAAVIRESTTSMKTKIPTPRATPSCRRMTATTTNHHRCAHAIVLDESTVEDMQRGVVATGGPFVSVMKFFKGCQDHRRTWRENGFLSLEKQGNSKH